MGRTVCDRCGELGRHRGNCRAAAVSQRRVDLTRGAGAEVVALWVQRYGAVCPGYGRETHRVRIEDLTADHVVPIAEGGGDEPANLRVLCRSCNSSRGNVRRGGGLKKSRFLERQLEDRLSELERGQQQG